MSSSSDDDEFGNLPDFTATDLASIDNLIQEELSSTSSPTTPKRKRSLNTTDDPLSPQDDSPIININRAPVLCLWAAVCVERQLSCDWPTALTFGKAIVSKFANKKAVALGFRERNKDEDDIKWKEFENKKKGIETVEVYNTIIDAIRKALPPTPPPKKTRANKRIKVEEVRDDEESSQKGLLRACVDGHPVDPRVAESSMKAKFGSRFEDARRTFRSLAAVIPMKRFGVTAHRLYTTFRPDVDDGPEGWGRGILDMRKEFT
ncbi:hypothetical protein BC829DRAFT_401424 [Chytridium lagenaria]|nr:hypothetical protein BC829DRAFT_401424 [Chytridium lagenaria]